MPPPVKGHLPRQGVEQPHALIVAADGQIAAVGGAERCLCKLIDKCVVGGWIDWLVGCVLMDGSRVEG